MIIVEIAIMSAHNVAKKSKETCVEKLSISTFHYQTILFCIISFCTIGASKSLTPVEQGNKNKHHVIIMVAINIH